MRKRLTLTAIIALLLVGMLGSGLLSSGAWFSDTETSAGNSFTAGTLDLLIDGGDANVVKFTLTNLRPGNQPTGSFTLKNNGSIDGYLDIKPILLQSHENGITEPELQAGDNTDNKGELEDVLHLTLYFDRDGDGYWSTGDTLIYSGMPGAMPNSFELNELLKAGASIKIMAVFDWWSTDMDNQAQGDSFTLDLTCQLGQTAGQ